MQSEWSIMIYNNRSLFDNLQLLIQTRQNFIQKMLGTVSNNQNQQTGLFSHNSHNQPSTGLFTQNGNSKPAFGGLFSQNNTFGLNNNTVNAQNTQPQHLFGQSNNQGGLFGQNNPQYNQGPFGSPSNSNNHKAFSNQSQNSLFTQPSPSNSPFGTSPSQSLFSQNQSNCNNPPISPYQSTIPSFNFNSYNLPTSPMASPFLTCNPFNGNYPSYCSSPLYQTQQMVPQWLLNGGLAQIQCQGNQIATQTLDVLNKLVTSVDQLNRLLTSLNLSNANSQNNSNNNPLSKQHSLDQEIKRKANNQLMSKQPQIYSFNQNPRKNMNTIQSKESAEDGSRLRQARHPTPKQTDLFASTKHKEINNTTLTFDQQQSKRQQTPASENPPQIGTFTVFPSLDRLKTMTTSQLKEIEGVKICNPFGSIEFLEPISLYQLDLTKGVKIQQDNIEVTDPQLLGKKVRMVFADFGNYQNLEEEEKGKLLQRMRTWIKQLQMTEVSHDSESGDLVVETLQ